MAASVVRRDGADLLASSRPGCGLVSVGVFFQGFPDQETPETAGLSWLLARSALRGAGGLDAEGLAVAAERLGGAIRPGVGAETVGWSVTVRPEAAAEAAALLRSVAAEARYAAEDVIAERDMLADDAARVRDDMFRYPLQRVLAEAFPDDPYGLPQLGTPESVRGLEPDAVRAGAARLRHSRALVGVAGDGDADALFRAADPFNAWPGTNGGRPAGAAPAWRAGRGDAERAKTQTALAMAFPAPGRASDDRYPLRVMASLLSGLAGRLFDELRERRALAYTVHAQTWLRRRAGALLTYIATGPDREGEARDAMLAELERLARDRVPEDELARARNYAAGLVAIRRQRTTAVLGEIADAWLHGELETLELEERRLRAVTAEQLSDVASRVLRPDQRAEYVVRGTRRAEPPEGTASG